MEGGGRQGGSCVDVRDTCCMYGVCVGGWEGVLMVKVVDAEQSQTDARVGNLSVAGHKESQSVMPAYEWD